MTGYESKKAAALDKLNDDDDTQVYKDHGDALTAAYMSGYHDGKKAAEPAQEPVAYDKTEMNGFVQDLYDKKMKEGKHGHYETMFHVVHQAIKRTTPPQRPLVELTDTEIDAEANSILTSDPVQWWRRFARAVLAKSREKNNGT